MKGIYDSLNNWTLKVQNKLVRVWNSQLPYRLVVLKYSAKLLRLILHAQAWKQDLIFSQVFTNLVFTKNKIGHFSYQEQHIKKTLRSFTRLNIKNLQTTFRNQVAF